MQSFTPSANMHWAPAMSRSSGNTVRNKIWSLCLCLTSATHTHRCLCLPFPYPHSLALWTWNHPGPEVASYLEGTSDSSHPTAALYKEGIRGPPATWSKMEDEASYIFYLSPCLYMKKFTQGFGEGRQPHGSAGKDPGLGESSRALTCSAGPPVVFLACCYCGQTEHFHFWSPSMRTHQATGFLFCTRSS